MSEFSYCPVCKEIVQGSEPCSCVFYVRGTLDDQGLLHTAKRVALSSPHCDICHSGVCDHVWGDES